MAPLSGYRIVEFGDASCIFAGRLLADLGADVIRIDAPEDATHPANRRLRPAAPFLDDVAHPDRSYGHLAFNAGKRLVAIDVAVPEGRAQFLELLHTSHGLIESGGQAAFDAIGLSAAAIAAANPSLARVSVTPFGLGGPWAGRAGRALQISSAGPGPGAWRVA